VLTLQLSEYQDLAQRTANTSLPFEKRLMVAALGLCGESGEVSEHIKKFSGHGHQLDVDKVKKELGDVLWYVAEIADLLGLDLNEIAQANISKLAARFPEGFSEWRSQNRTADDV